MAIATVAILLWTLSQTDELTKSSRTSDLQYVENIQNELTHVMLFAHKLADDSAPPTSLEANLNKLLVAFEVDPRVSANFRDQLPGTAEKLEDLKHYFQDWSRRLNAADADPNAIALEIVREADVLLYEARKAVNAVQQFGEKHTEKIRLKQLAQFKFVSNVLAGLLLATGFLVWRIVRNARESKKVSIQLSQANRQLEVRVASRTRKLEESRALLSFILDNSPSDLVLADVESGKVHFMNRKLTDHLGLKEVPSHLFVHQLLYDPDEGASLTQALDQYGQVDALEAQIGDLNPSWRSLSARLIEVDGHLAHLLWGFDISRHKELESQLRELATRDALTGLLNRRAFLESSTALFDHCRRHTQPCAVLMIDIDFFKRINDEHGHQTGDAALQSCSRAINSALRDADLLGRLGGEEFAALLPHSSKSGALKIAERIRDALAQMPLAAPNGAALSLTVSIGVAEMQSNHRSIDSLLADADQALYRAKASGRNKVLAFEPVVRQP